jgi:hypothetical protein
VGGSEPFSLQSSLHVGDPYDHRVDVTGSDKLRQPVGRKAWRGVAQLISPNSCTPLVNSAYLNESPLTEVTVGSMNNEEGAARLKANTT